MQTVLLRKKIEALEAFLLDYETSNSSSEFFNDVYNEYHEFIIDYKGAKLELSSESFRELILTIEGVRITKRRDSDVINISKCI